MDVESTDPYKDQVSPYVDWFYTKEYPDLFRKELIVALLPDLQPLSGPSVTEQYRKSFYEDDFGDGSMVPVPDGALPADGLEIEEEFQFSADTLKALAEQLDEHAVIPCIIDSGIALGHARFRRGPGQTRFLASWQQAAQHDCSTRKKAAAVTCDSQRSLPFGQQLFQSDIEDAMAAYTVNGTLDEDRFNRALGLSTPTNVFAPRELEGHAAHGTHVLDLAAGEEPPEEPSQTTQRPIIAVNLPDRFSHGSAGNFLEFFAIRAMQWIERLTDAVWAYKMGLDPGEKSDTQGFRLVINLSYGKQAGPKNGSTAFEACCADLIKRTDGRIAVVLPAGNDNLDRAHFHKLMGGKKRKVFPGHLPNDVLRAPWRIVPQDQTSNFLEAWTSPVKLTPENFGEKAGAEYVPFTMALQAPGEDEGSLVFFSPKLDTKIKFSDAVYAYCERIISKVGENGPDDPGDLQIRVLFCMMPTLSWNLDATAQAGLWHVHFKYSGAENLEFSLNIQSDQALSPGSRIAKRSYFDHPRYHNFTQSGDVRRKKWPSDQPPPILPVGQPVDTYNYPDGFHLDNWEYRGPVQRKGTLNAIATATGVCAIGGYRVSDGRPAPYSSTTKFGLRDEDKTKASAIMALFPTDAGYARPGMRAAGSRSGSTEIWQGTSMAAAQATRYLVSVCRKSVGQNPTQDVLKRFVEPDQFFNRAGWPEVKNWESYKMGDGRAVTPEVPDLKHARR